LQSVPTRRQPLPRRPAFLYVSDLTSSRFPGFTVTRPRGNSIFAGGKSVRLQSAFRVSCGKWASLSLVVLLSVSTARGQGPAPETAPPLFPGGGLISSVPFTTRGLVPQSLAGIPATARPTFAHEDGINFTWGFYRNFDLTISCARRDESLCHGQRTDRWRNRFGRCHGTREVPLLSARLPTRHHADIHHGRPEDSNRPNKTWQRTGLTPGFST